VLHEGVTPRQAHDWRKFAEVPQERFEAALAYPIQKPSAAGSDPAPACGGMYQAVEPRSPCLDRLRSYLPSQGFGYRDAGTRRA